MHGVDGVDHQLQEPVAELGARMMVAAGGGRHLGRLGGRARCHAAAGLRAHAGLAGRRHRAMLQHNNIYVEYLNILTIIYI